ncbi:MAG: dTDP-glucose 4,6-dehydratase [Granulosicoccus sp.]|nr:dTDP-glucose 4,6-dehydratase [Granulosicoccus sp.]
MRRMLVTGAAGFIGANFVRYWLDKHPEDVIVVVDALTYAGNRANLEGVLGQRCSLVACDINETETIKSLLREHKLDTIVHFAAESHVDRSIEGPDVFIEANILGTHSLLKAARQVWQSEGQAADNHHFHHVSTDEVYGTLTMEEPAFSEDTPYAPNSPYSASKASSDFLVRSYHHTYGMNVTTSNCSNNYGPYHFPEKLIPLIIINLLHGKSLPIYGDGKNIRDWLYVEDHARGIELILDKGRIGETYNIGGVNEWANIDIVKLICRLMDERFTDDPTLGKRFSQCPAATGIPCDSLITFVTDRAGHDFRYAIDTTRIREELGYTPSITFENGIRNTLDWYLSNPAWWQAILDGSYRVRPESRRTVERLMERLTD